MTALIVSKRFFLTEPKGQS